MERFSYPLTEFRGSWREIGKQHGEAYRALIQDQVGSTLQTAVRQGAKHDDALAWAMAHDKHIKKIGPHWMDELSGLAEGAHISLPEALAIQLRPGSGEIAVPEACTSFGIAEDATANRHPIGGQTRDIHPSYQEVMFIGKFRPTDGPAILAHCVPGELGGIGLNEHGVCVFANTLWPRSRRASWLAFPILRRLMLESRSADDGARAAQGLGTFIAGNLLLIDRRSEIRNLEMFPEGIEIVCQRRGAYVHANNCTVPVLEQHEDTAGIRLQGSEGRRKWLHDQLNALIGHLTVAKCKQLLTDESGSPEPICRRARVGSAIATVAGIIAEPAERRLHVSYGPPSISHFTAYSI